MPPCCVRACSPCLPRQLRKFLDGKHPYLDRIRENIAELQDTPQAWGSQALQALLNELGVAPQ